MQYTMNEDETFGFQWDVDSKSNGFIYGIVQIIIGDKIYPKSLPHENHYTLTTIFGNLKSSFEEKLYCGENNNQDFGEKEFDIEKYNSSQLDNVLYIGTSYMGSGMSASFDLDSLLLCMGYSENTERLFYSFNYGESFDEIRYPKGTVESVINALPNYKELESFIAR